MSKQSEQSEVMVSVVPVSPLIEALEEKMKMLEGAEGDDYFNGFKACLHFCESKAHQLEVDVPTSVLTNQNNE